MQANREALIQDIKNDVLADIQRSNYQLNSRYTMPNVYSANSNGNYQPNNWRYISPNISQADVQNIKNDIMYDLRNDIYNPVYNSSYDLNPYMQNPYNDVISESVKRELMTEIEAQRASRMAETAGYGQLLSDQKLNRLIDQRYRTLEGVKNDIRRELQSIQRMETQGTGSDPYIREVAQAIAMEARQQGVSINQVMKKMDGTNSQGTGNGVWGRMSSVINIGQRKGFLYGIGAAALVYLLLPIARNNLHSVAVRSMEEGMSFAERARSFVTRNKEGDFSDSIFDEKKPDIDILDE